MKTLKIILLDTNKYDVEDLLKSPYLTKENLKAMNKIGHLLTRKEKTGSLILKNKYVKDYYVRKDGKPVSDSTYFSVSHSFGVVVIVFCKHIEDNAAEHVLVRLGVEPELAHHGKGVFVGMAHVAVQVCQGR